VIQGRAEERTGRGSEGGAGPAGRKRAAVELIARHGATLKRTARRYSLDSEDAEDAYQRALEIVLTKAPTTDPRELIRWTQTVIKHEALAVRRNRQRLLGTAVGDERRVDPVALIPAPADGPAEQLERRDAIARTREALRALKPAELRALTLLAEGYSYAEIGEITGFSHTKINRSLSEGRERFRRLIASSEDGSRCRELQPLLSAFCDGEASAAEEATVREHLRACPHCRTTLRTYRIAPGLAAALVPFLPAPRPLPARLRELLARFGSHAGATKQAALCAGLAGGATACLATGTLPVPQQLLPNRTVTPTIERAAESPAPAPRVAEDEPAPASKRRKPAPRRAASQAEEAPPEAEYAPSEAVEYEAPVPAPPAAPPPAGEAPTVSSGSAAGEFGP